MVEVEDKVMGKMFGRVAYKFQEQISKVGKRTFVGAYLLIILMLFPAIGWIRASRPTTATS